MIVPLFGSLLPTSVKAALTDSPTSWSNFTWEPYLHNGNPVYDEEGSADSSNGGTAVEPDEIDIASGAGNLGPGTEISVFFAYYDGGTPGDAAYADDFFAFRTRLVADPQFGTGYISRHWDVLLDIDGDNWKEFVIDLAGDFSSSAPDRLYVLYNDADTNTYDPDPVPAGDLVSEFYAANNSDTGDPQTYNHTRVVPATGGADPDQVWLDVQIPITALKDDLGVQQVYPSTRFALFYSTSASNTNPLQKDWMLTPFSFGDPLMPNVEATKTHAMFDDADGSGGYTSGDTILYTVVTTNDGNLDASGVTFSDTPDTNTTLQVGSVTTTQGNVMTGNSPSDTTVEVSVGTVAAGGGSVTITFKVTINWPLPPGATQISNEGTISGTNITDEPTDDPGTGTDDDATISMLQRADVAVTKVVDDPTPVEEATITYTVTVTNNGPSQATNVLVTDILPDGTTYFSDNPSQGSYDNGTGFWTVGTLADGASATLEIVATVDSSTGGSTITNTASVTAVDQVDPDPGNDSDYEDIVVNRPPDQPSNVSPLNGDCVSLPVTLQSSAFSDPDGDSHDASRWQVTTTPGDYSSPVFDSGRDTVNLTSITVPLGVLSDGVTYYWHVRHQDNTGTWSTYSTETSFCTANTPTGSDVTVTQNGISTTFTQVTVGGCTNVTTSTENPAGPIPSHCCQVGAFVDVTTTATYGVVTVCISYDDTGCPNESALRLFHWNGTGWDDVTTSLDPVSNIICGDVTVLSPFYICGPCGGVGAAGVSAFPSLYVGISAAFAAAVLAFIIRSRLEPKKVSSSD